MTITVSVTTPSGKQAKVVRADGVEETVLPGATRQFTLHDDASVITIAAEAALTGDDDGGVATTQGGGNGNGPPPPVPGD